MTSFLERIFRPFTSNPQPRLTQAQINTSEDSRIAVTLTTNTRYVTARAGMTVGQLVEASFPEANNLSSFVITDGRLTRSVSRGYVLTSEDIVSGAQIKHVNDSDRFGAV